MFLLLTLLLQSPGAAVTSANPVALDNEYVRVTRNAAPCASAKAGECEDRVIVAMDDIELRFADSSRRMKRGDVAVFKAGQSYQPPSGGTFFEVAVKPNRPAVKCPAVIIPAQKNKTVYEGDRFFIYEELLEPGDSRPLHSHCQRIEMPINRGPMFQGWTEGQDPPPIPVRAANWRDGGTHLTRNVGDLLLRNLIVEFKPETGK
jgi:hypothetical protein